MGMAAENNEEQAPSVPLATLNPIRFELKLLKDLGPSLPVGVVVGTQWSKLFRLRPFRLKEERAVAGYKEVPGTTVGTFVASVLGHMIQTVGPHSFDTASDAQKQLTIGQLTMADVLYMYLYLRYHAMGPDEPLGLSITCPRCRVPYDWDADLSTLEVRTIPEGASIDLRWPYELRDGITIRGQHVTRLWLEPVKWHLFTVPGFASGNQADREAATMKASIIGADGIDTRGAPLHITDAEMDELTKYDFEGLSRAIEDSAPGPRMIVESRCPSCRSVVNQMIEWANYDTFFARSARRKPGKS